MSKIHLAKNLSFDPREIATEVTALIGMRGSGKSNGAAVVAEHLLDVGVQVIVLDYVGIWPSLRLQPDGKTPSRYQIPVIGGRHGDIGLQPVAGALVAESLAQSGEPAVLDISGFKKNDRCRFAADFAERVFECKKDHPSPTLLILEEAQRFVPQQIRAGQEFMARMLGAFEEIAEVGRNFGLGLALLTQRPQKIAKDVLNLADNVFAFRLNGVLERKAISEWVQEKGVRGREEVSGELPGLPLGNALVWSPVRKIYGKFELPKKTTYDAGATPLHARAAVKLKPLDLGALEKSMAAVVEQSKANDPKELKSEITRLRAEVAKLQKMKAPSAPTTVPIKSVIKTATVEGMEKVGEALAGAEANMSCLTDDLKRAISFMRDAMNGHTKHMVPIRGAAETAPSKNGTNGHAQELPPSVSRQMPLYSDRQHFPSKDSGDGAPGEMRMLNALASSTTGELSNTHLAAISMVKKSGGTYATYKSRLKNKGLIDVAGDRIRITDAGLDVIGHVEQLSGQSLLDSWLGSTDLNETNRRMLKAIVEAGPDGLDNAAWAEAVGVDARGGTYATYKSRLVSRGLVEKRGAGRFAPSPLFFQ